MANGTVNFTINLDGNAYTGVAQIDKALGNVLVDVKKTQSWFSKFKDSIGASAIRMDAFIGVVDKVSQGFQSLVGTSLDFEQQQANLKTLLNGDAEATENLVAQIREYGKATVYDRSGLVEAQKTMMAFGLDSEFAFGKLKNIGDIALGDSQKMQSLSLAFAQATSSGKLMGQDLMQMINAGFNPLEVISQKTGKSMSQLKDEMSKGQISADLLAQSLEWATEEGGRFYQGAESAAQTTAGRIAKMKDTIDEMKVSLFEATGGATAYIAEIGQMIVPLAQLSPVFTAIGTSIKWCKNHWSGFVNAVKKGAVEVNVAIKWCKSSWNSFMQSIRKGVMIVGLNLGIMKFSIASTGGMFKVMSLVAKNACRSIGVAIKSIPIIGWIAAIISLIIGVVTTLWEKCEGFRRLVMGVWESIKAIFYNVWVVIKAVFDVVWNNIIKPYFDFLKSIFVGIWEAAKWCLDKIVEGVTWLWDKVVNIATSIGDFFVGIWTWVTDTVSNAFNWIVDKLGIVGTWIKEKLVDPIKNAFTGIWTVIKNVFNKILNGLGKLFNPIKELWNKIFPKDQFKDVSDAYQIGAEKGSESWRNSQKEKAGEIAQDELENAGTEEIDFKDTSVLGNSDDKNEKSLTTSTIPTVPNNLGDSAGTSAGKAQQINITLKSMVETMNFNGGLRENAHDVEAILREQMARILGMAETAV